MSVVVQKTDGPNSKGKNWPIAYVLKGTCRSPSFGFWSRSTERPNKRPNPVKAKRTAEPTPINWKAQA